MDSYVCCECGCPYNYYTDLKHASRKSCKESKSGHHYFENKYILSVKKFFSFIFKKIINLFKKN